MSIEYGQLDDFFWFHFAANDTSGSGADGATPTCYVRLCGAAANAAPVYEPTPVLLSHVNYPAGCYEVEIEATEANGFVADSTYEAFCSLAVDGKHPTGSIGKFKLALATVDGDWATGDEATTIIAHLADIKGVGWTSDNTMETIGNATIDSLPKFDTMVEQDGAVYRFTTNALEQGPSGTVQGGDATAENQTEIMDLINGLSIPTASENADALLDEQTAGHQGDGTFGKAITSGGDLGTGLYLRTLHVTDNLGRDVADADVYLTSDLVGSVKVTQTEQTDSDGNVSFYVDLNCNYYIWAQKDGLAVAAGVLWTTV